MGNGVENKKGSSIVIEMQFGFRIVGNKKDPRSQRLGSDPLSIFYIDE